MKLEECRASIQNPTRLRELTQSLSRSSQTSSPLIRQPLKDMQNDSEGLTAGEMSENEMTMKYLQRLSELEDLRSEDAILTRQYKEEKQRQIATNAELLKKIAERADSQSRRRSSLF